MFSTNSDSGVTSCAHSYTLLFMRSFPHVLKLVSGNGPSPHCGRRCGQGRSGCAHMQHECSTLCPGKVISPGPSKSQTSNDHVTQQSHCGHVPRRTESRVSKKSLDPGS